MKTANRKPKLNRKPTKGMKSFFKQQANGLAKALRAITSAAPDMTKQNFYTAKAVRAKWLYSLRGSHMPHQGGQEKARRVRQMANNTHGYPWGYDPTRVKS
jgi:hypothetical protein